MKRVLICVLFLMLALLPGYAQDAGLPIGVDSNPVTVRGRIVLYDWFSHDFSADEDFVVKTLDPKLPYIRVMYRPQWGFDAPTDGSKKVVLDRWAFIAHGAMWEFSVLPMKTDKQTNWCRLKTLAYKYDDETGKGEIPRFLPTPGASNLHVPPVQGLPCFVLRPGGLKGVPLADSK